MSGRAIGIIGVLAFALGVGLTVPAAFADDPAEYPSVTQGASATSAAAVRPDDLPGARGPGSVVVESEPTVVAVTDGGFDWTDAAIGGLVVLGVVAVTGLVVWSARHHGPPTGRHAPT